MGERGRVAGWALALNLAWEVAQAPLNTCPAAPRTWMRAAAGDAALTIVVAELTARRVHLAAGLTATALAIEAHALARGRWTYRPAMPTVGRVGLLPLAQLPLLGVTATVLARQERRARRRARPAPR